MCHQRVHACQIDCICSSSVAMSFLCLRHLLVAAFTNFYHGHDVLKSRVWDPPSFNSLHVTQTSGSTTDLVSSHLVIEIDSWLIGSLIGTQACGQWFRVLCAGVVQQSVDGEQLLLLVGALCSDAVRSVDQAPAQQQLLAVIYNTISLAGNAPSHSPGLLKVAIG